MMEQQFEIGQQVTYRHEVRGGYGYVLDVPAIILKPGKRRIGIAALTKRGEWVPRYVKPEKLAALHHKQRLHNFPLQFVTGKNSLGRWPRRN